MGLWSRLANAVRGDRLIDDIDEELAAHLAEAAEHGRDPEEARRALGPLQRHRETSRDVRQVGWLADFVMDFRYAIRGFGRHITFNQASYEIVGVARDAKYFTLTESPPAFVYFSTLQTDSGFI